MNRRTFFTKAATTALVAAAAPSVLASVPAPAPAYYEVAATGVITGEWMFVIDLAKYGKTSVSPDEFITFIENHLSGVGTDGITVIKRDKNA